MARDVEYFFTFTAASHSHRSAVNSERRRSLGEFNSVQFVAWELEHSRLRLSCRIGLNVFCFHVFIDILSRSSAPQLSSVGSRRSRNMWDASTERTPRNLRLLPPDIRTLINLNNTVANITFDGSAVLWSEQVQVTKRSVSRSTKNVASTVFLRQWQLPTSDK